MIGLMLFCGACILGIAYAGWLLTAPPRPRRTVEDWGVIGVNMRPPRSPSCSVSRGRICMSQQENWSTVGQMQSAPSMKAPSPTQWDDTYSPRHRPYGGAISRFPPGTGTASGRPPTPTPEAMNANDSCKHGAPHAAGCPLCREEIRAWIASGEAARAMDALLREQQARAQVLAILIARRPDLREHLLLAKTSDEMRAIMAMSREPADLTDDQQDTARRMIEEALGDG